MTKTIFKETYYCETLPDLEEDLYCVLNELNLPIDEHGFFQGSFKVIVEYNKDG